MSCIKSSVSVCSHAVKKVAYCTFNTFKHVLVETQNTNMTLNYAHHNVSPFTNLTPNGRNHRSTTQLSSVYHNIWNLSATVKPLEKWLAVKPALALGSDWFKITGVRRGTFLVLRRWIPLSVWRMSRYSGFCVLRSVTMSSHLET